MNTKAILTVILAGAWSAAGAFAQDAFKSDQEKSSYAIGLNIGKNWKQQDIEVNYDQLVRGLKDAMAGGTTLLTEQETREVLNKFQQELGVKQQEKRRIVAEKNKTDGETFLAVNKTNAGVTTTASGLQYKVLANGTGDAPKPEDTVTVNYRGTLIDGTEFDSSAKSGRPATFRVGGVIKGWTEALTQMKTGSKWQLFIPSELAYGEMGRPPQIGGNSVLLFDVELVSVQPAPPPTPAPAPLTSDIIKVPSLEEMKKGAKIETIKAEDVERLQKEQQQKEQQPKK